MFVDFFIRRPIFATVCALLIVLAGAVWGLVPGILRARLGVNEIIDMALNGPLSFGVFVAGLSLLAVFGAVMGLTKY